MVNGPRLTVHWHQALLYYVILKAKVAWCAGVKQSFLVERIVSVRSFPCNEGPLSNDVGREEMKDKLAGAYRHTRNAAGHYPKGIGTNTRQQCFFV